MDDTAEQLHIRSCPFCEASCGTRVIANHALRTIDDVRGDPAELALWVLKGQRPASMPVGRYSTQMLQFGWMKPADAAGALSIFVSPTQPERTAPMRIWWRRPRKPSASIAASQPHSMPATTNCNLGPTSSRLWVGSGLAA